MKTKPMKSKLGKSKRVLEAFTLVEVMVAMLVLAIGLLGLAGITAVVVRTNLTSTQVGKATQVATDLMDKLSSKDLSNFGDCQRLTSVPSTCSLITQSGLNNNTDFYPQTKNGKDALDTSCGIKGVVGNVIDTSYNRTFDVVRYTANGIEPATGFSDGGASNGDFSEDTQICNLSSLNLPNGYYLRYFRSYAPTVGSAMRNIVVVILWKDRFGRWRKTNFKSSPR